MRVSVGWSVEHNKNSISEIVSYPHFTDEKIEAQRI